MLSHSSLEEGLYTSEVVMQVLDQLREGLRPGQIILDTTTGEPVLNLARHDGICALRGHRFSRPAAAVLDDLDVTARALLEAIQEARASIDSPQDKPRGRRRAA